MRDHGRVKNSYFDWLSDDDGGEEASEDRCQPLLCLLIAELDTTSDDEENGDSDGQIGEDVGDDETPPWKKEWSFSLAFRLSRLGCRSVYCWCVALHHDECLVQG